MRTGTSSVSVRTFASTAFARGRYSSGSIVAASPTRGLDVSSIETVHAYLREAASTGVGVLLVSEDLDEILALADRIAVMYEGVIAGERDAGSATVEELGLLMAGGQVDD